MKANQKSAEALRKLRGRLKSCIRYSPAEGKSVQSKNSAEAPRKLRGSFLLPFRKICFDLAKLTASLVVRGRAINGD